MKCVRNSKHCRMGGSENAVKTCMNLRNQQLKVITNIYRENDVHKSHGNHKPKI